MGVDPCVSSGVGGVITPLVLLQNKSAINMLLGRMAFDLCDPDAMRSSGLKGLSKFVPEVSIILNLPWPLEWLLDP